MTTTESPEVGRHARNVLPEDEQALPAAEKPRHSLDYSLTPEEDAAQAADTPITEADLGTAWQQAPQPASEPLPVTTAVRDSSPLALGKYSEIITKKYKPAEGQSEGPVHLYGVHYVDGERKEEHLSWEDVAGEYSKTLGQPEDGAVHWIDTTRAPGYWLDESNLTARTAATIAATRASHSDMSDEIDRGVAASLQEDSATLPQRATALPEPAPEGQTPCTKSIAWKQRIGMTTT
jgi:hypothetical protein